MKDQALNTVITLLIFFVTLFAYTKLVGPIPFSVDSVVTNKSDIYTVNGEGKVSIKPDIAVVRLGVDTNAKTVKEAQELMNSKINKVTESIKALGVEEKDIKTENYSIYPNYENNPVPPKTTTAPTKSVIAISEDNNAEVLERDDSRISGYNANTNLSIKVKNIDKVNEILDVATNDGANQIGGITFDVDDRSKPENEARQKAVDDAKKKAQDASKIAGFKLGKLINYYENPGDYYGYSGRSVELKEDGVTPSTSIEPGSTEIVINVTLSYEIN